MSENIRSVAMINRKIRDGKAVVLSDRELVQAIRKGRTVAAQDVDVVITSWNASIAGSAVMLCVPVAERGVFTRARNIWLNGVPGFPGPAPNERLGVVDTLIFAERTGEKREYNGTMLFVDILRKKEIGVECLSEGGRTFRSTFRLDDLQFARMYVYNCFLDSSDIDDAARSINPCRHFRSIVAGSKVLLNRAKGVVIGNGSRSTSRRRALSLAADMFEMDPGIMTLPGGKDGTNVVNSVALAVPVLCEDGLRDLSSWLLTREARTREDALPMPESNMSEYLKELVIKGIFLLTESDMKMNLLDFAWPAAGTERAGGRFTR